MVPCRPFCSAFIPTCCPCCLSAHFDPDANGGDLLSPAGAHRRLLLRPGHQPAAGRLPAGHRSHAVHRDSRPHDLCDLLRLQRLLRGLRGDQERTSEEGRTPPTASRFLPVAEGPFGSLQSQRFREPERGNSG